MCVCVCVCVCEITFLEFEQVVKDYLDLEIWRALIKLLDQTERKTKKI